MTRETELDALVGIGRSAKAAGAGDVEHLDGRAAAYNYVRIADLVCAYCRNDAERLPILDWGCGYGQVSWLLQGRGLDVEPYDIEQRILRSRIPQLDRLTVVYGEDRVRLPFESNRFGAVLSVGVLEHVDDFDGSLAEVNRVLRVGGLLFVLMLPNSYSWAESIADRRGISAHPYKFTFGRASGLLRRHGFEIERRWRRNVLPRNLTGCGPWVKQSYGRYYRAVDRVDQVLSRISPVCCFSGVIEMIARKH